MKPFLLMILLVSVAQSLYAIEVTEEKVALIDKLLVQTKQSPEETGKLYRDLFVKQITQGLQKSQPDIDAKAFDIVEQEVEQLIGEVMIENGTLSKLMYPIYGKYFSEDELQELVALYDTELGKKLLQTQAAIAQEGLQARQALGQLLTPKIERRVLGRFESEGINFVAPGVPGPSAPASSE